MTIFISAEASSGVAALSRLGCGLCLLLAATALRAEGPDLDEARRLLDAGQNEQSAALLERDLLRFAGNADYDYLLGLALYRAGQSGPAQFAFERVLMAAPDNVDSRLTLARIGIERGNQSLAADALQPLSAQRLGSEQQRQLEHLRAELAAASGGRLSLRGYVLGGIGWDNNVTSGPDQQSLLIPTLSSSPTSLGSAAQDADGVSVVETGVTMIKAVDADTWLTGTGTARIGENRRRRDVREGFANLDLGVVHRSGSEFFGASVSGQEYFVAAETYRKAFGLRLNWMHPLADGARLTGYAQHLVFDYPDHGSDNSARRVLGFSVDSTTGDGARTMQYGLYRGDEKAQDPLKPQFGFRQLGLQLGGSLRLNADWSISTGVVYEERRHKSPDPLYLVMRRDRQFSLGIAADYRISPGWHLIPHYVYTRNGSNAELYDFARKAFMLHLKWEFDHGKN